MIETQKKEKGKERRDPRSGRTLEDFSPKTGSALLRFMFMGSEQACQEFKEYFERRCCKVLRVEQPVLRYFVDIRPRFRPHVYRELSRMRSKGITRGEFSPGYLVTQEEVGKQEREKGALN